MHRLTRVWLTALAVTLACAGCAGGGAGDAGPGHGSIEMYGTIDEGISVHK